MYDTYVYMSTHITGWSVQVHTIFYKGVPFWMNVRSLSFSFFFSSCFFFSLFCCLFFKSANRRRGEIMFCTKTQDQVHNTTEHGKIACEHIRTYVHTHMYVCVYIRMYMHSYILKNTYFSYIILYVSTYVRTYV